MKDCLFIIVSLFFLGLLIYVPFSRKKNELILRAWADKNYYSIKNFRKVHSRSRVSYFETLSAGGFLLDGLRKKHLYEISIQDEEGGTIDGYVYVSGTVDNPQVEWCNSLN